MNKKVEQLVTKLSIEAIAFLLDVSRMTAWRIRKGTRQLTVDEFDKLKEAQLSEVNRSPN